MKNGEIDLVMNTTEGLQAVKDSREIRSVALYDKIPYFTTAAAAHAAESLRHEPGNGVRRATAARVLGVGAGRLVAGASGCAGALRRDAADADSRR